MGKYLFLIVSLGLIAYGIYIIKTGRAFLKSCWGPIELEGEDAGCVGALL